MTENKKLLFYGAGEHAELIYKRVKELITPREPAAFIDGDPYKQGRTLCGLTIYSYSDAVAKYGDDFDIYVTGNEKNAPDIIGFLLENGVESKRILNYEPVEKRLGCEYVENLLTLVYSGNNVRVYFCCRCRRRFDSVEIEAGITEDFQLDSFNAETFKYIIDKKMQIADSVLHSSSSAECRKCSLSKQQHYFFVNRKIRMFTFGGDAPCNFNCFHCALGILVEKSNADVWGLLQSHLKLLLNNMNISEICTATLALGEPSIGKNLDEVLNLLSNQPLLIFSNAYVYSKPIEDALIRGITWLRVSVDSGTPETFKRIKGVEGFNQVSENLERYAKFGTVILKYIIFRGQNDNESDIQGFIKLCDKIGAKAEFSKDFSDNELLSEKTLEFAYYFIHHFCETGKLYAVDVNLNERKLLRELFVHHGEQVPFCLL